MGLRSLLTFHAPIRRMLASLLEVFQIGASNTMRNYHRVLAVMLMLRFHESYACSRGVGHLRLLEAPISHDFPTPKLVSYSSAPTTNLVLKRDYHVLGDRRPKECVLALTWLGLIPCAIICWHPPNIQQVWGSSPSIHRKCGLGAKLEILESTASGLKRWCWL